MTDAQLAQLTAGLIFMSIGIGLLVSCFCGK